ncbi:MAG: acyltransferase [Planctomycetota bacterium]
MFKAIQTSYAKLLDRCSRVTSGGALIPEIDGLRFIAITLVFFNHVCYYIGEKRFEFTGIQTDYDSSFVASLYLTGFVGVPIFFAISGFILSLPFAEAALRGKPAPVLTRYYLRRLTRLEPPFLINLLLAFAMLYAVRGTQMLSWTPNLFAGMGYVHGAIYGSKNPVNFVTWSLEIEVQFYLIAPLLFSVFHIKQKAFRRGILLACMLLYPSLVNTDAQHLFLTGFLQFFLAGILLADLYVADDFRTRPKSAVFDVLSVVAFIVLIGRLYLKMPSSTGTAALCVFLFEWGALRGKVLGWLLSLRTITTIGGMCYTIYLYHMLIIYVIGKIAMRLYMPNFSLTANLLIQTLVFAPPVLVTSGILFVWIERPFMSFRLKTATK